jgi:hypothetical protein
MEKQLRLCGSTINARRKNATHCRKMHDSIGLLWTQSNVCPENSSEPGGQATPESLNALITLPAAIEIPQDHDRSSAFRPDDSGLWLPSIGLVTVPPIYANIQVSQRIRTAHDVSEHLKIVIFRVLQEALNNTPSDSKAAQVEVSLRSGQH